MSLDVRMFENISPSRFISFTIPNSQSHLLRVSVLDSPLHSSSSPPRVAAMLVPKLRESDWIFTTESGHLQLLLNIPEISRLILIFNNPDNDTERLKPLVLALSPNNDDVTFVTYEDNIISSVVIEKTNEMIIEDVEIEISEGVTEFRRRLRFKRMPNLVQSDVKIVRKGLAVFEIDLCELVHPYLAPMVASLSLLGEFECERKALCVGVGGGGLVSYLKVRLGFEVTGVEIDHEVLRVARKYFGLEERFARVYVEDGIEFLKRVCDDGDDDMKFDVLMVDLDSTDPIHGVSAPPIEFMAKDVLIAARSVLVPSGVFVINVIPPNKTFYEELKEKFRQVFTELYEIDVGNGENFVLIATAEPGDRRNSFISESLTSAVLLKYINAIQRL